MASRTSIYTNALKLPDWVMGGEFGDLSRIMNARDLSYENVAQNEQQTQINDYNLEKRQREERTREILNDRMGASRPATIREAYEQMANAAYEAGDPETALEYESKREAYDQAQLAKKRAEFTGALGIADNTSYGRVNEMYPGVLTEDDYNRNQKRKRAGDIKSSDMVVVMNTNTGAKERIPWTEAKKAQELGWEVDPSASRQQDILDGIEQRRDEMENPPQPGFFSRLINPTVAEPAPVPRPSPTPAPQDGRGDRARQGPTIGDQVKVIKRERSVKGK